MRELDGGLFQLQPWRLTLNGESEKSLRDTETCIVDKRVYGKLPVTQLQHFPKPLRSADYQGKTWICLHLRDRKSTRLNSSHRCISYAVFCLKKKNTTP